MSLQMLSKNDLGEWIDSLRAHYRVIGPKRMDDIVEQKAPTSRNRSSPNHYIFGDIQEAKELEISYPTTILPPKKVLLPLKEKLFSYRENGEQIELQLEDRPTIILGLHTCDLHAIISLDHIHTRGMVDQHYLARRSNTILVSIECLEPCSDNAFCKDMGTWTIPETFDLHLTDLGQDYLIEIGSPKGVELLKHQDVTTDPTNFDYQRYDQTISAKWPCFPYRLEPDAGELPSLMAVSYRSPLWEELGQKCLGCGSCTIVCPTCHCFDVFDEANLDLTSGSRYRAWDSCQNNQFALVAGGHDFRNSRASRLRHRFNHKYKYQPEYHNLPGCVGCGRCAETCLVKIKPTEVLNKLHRKRAAEKEARREVLV